MKLSNVEELGKYLEYVVLIDKRPVTALLEERMRELATLLEKPDAEATRSRVRDGGRRR